MEPEKEKGGDPGLHLGFLSRITDGSINFDVCVVTTATST